MKYTDDQAKTCIDDRVRIVQNHWQSKRDLWQEIYSLYRFWTTTESDVAMGERSNIFIPLAFSLIETKLPRMVQALLSLDPFFKVEGRSRKDHPNAEFMSKVMWYQMNDEVNAFYPLMMWFKEAMIYGNSHMFVGWEKETAEVIRRVPRMAFGTEVIGYDLKPVKDVMYDGIALNHLDIFDCYPSPHGTRINGRRYERLPYFIIRSEPTADYLKSLSSKQDQNGKPILNKAAVDDIIKRFPQGYGDVDENRKDRMSYNKMVEAGQNDTYAPKYVMWTMFENDWWVSKIGDTIVRNSNNPFGDNRIPIIKAIDTPIPHEYDCIGQIEPIIKLQYYANDLENLKLDYLFKSINPGMIVSSDSGLDVQKFQDDPDGIHVARGNPNVAYSIINRANATAFNSTQEQINLERLIDKVLGQSDVSRGVSRPGKDTATEVVSLIEQANFRFDLSARLLKHESLMPLLECWANRNVMFFPYEKEIRTYDEDGNPDFLNIPVSRIVGEYRFKMKTNPSQGNKFAYAQTLIRFLDVLRGDQGQHPALTQEIAKYLQIDNAEEMVDNPVQQAVAVIAQAAQEGLLANGQQAALVLAEVLNVLAPAGSDTAARAGRGLSVATDERDVAQQMAGNLRAQ